MNHSLSHNPLKVLPDAVLALCTVNFCREYRIWQNIAISLETDDISLETDDEFVCDFCQLMEALMSILLDNQLYPK
jgi:hypothetical protein